MLSFAIEFILAGLLRPRQTKFDERSFATAPRDISRHDEQTYDPFGPRTGAQGNQTAHWRSGKRIAARTDFQDFFFFSFFSF